MAAHRQQERGLHVAGRQLAVSRPHAPGHPLRNRVLDVHVGLLPRQVRRHVHLLQPGLAALPAEMHQEIGAGGERVGNAVDQVAAAVPVEVDRVLEIVAGGELQPAELAGPVADHFGNALVAVLHDAQRGEQLLAEEVGPPAVIGERGERAQDAVVAEHLAEIALQAPKGGEHRGRHAVGLLDAGEDRGIFLHRRLAVLHAVAGDQLVGELQEGEVEDRLALVAPDDGGIEGQVGRGLRQHPRRDALRQGVLLEVGQPFLEAAGVAATRGHGRARQEDGEQNRRPFQRRFAHGPHPPSFDPRICPRAAPGQGRMSLSVKANSWRGNRQRWRCGNDRPAFARREAAAAPASRWPGPHWVASRAVRPVARDSSARNRHRSRPA